MKLKKILRISLEKKTISLMKVLHSIKKNTLDIFKQFVRRAIATIDQKNLVITNLYEQIIQEIRYLKTQKVSGKKSVMNAMNLFILLKSFPKFNSFLLYYSIPTINILSCLQSIEVSKYKKNEYVFNAGDEGKFFYIIIKGAVSVKEVAVKDGKYNIVDKVTLTPGQGFGEVAVMYGLRRSNTIVSIEDTVLLGIPSDVFVLNLKIPILKAERIRREKICIAIPALTEVPFKDFISVYKNFVFFTVKKMNYIFKEGEVADSFYIIAKGRGKLERNKKTLISIDEHCLTGLEASEYLESNCQAVYTNSLLAINDCDVIRIRVDRLGRLYHMFVDGAKKLKEKKTYLISDICDHFKEEKSRFSIHYHEKKIQEEIRTNKTVTNTQVDSIIREFSMEKEKQMKENLKYKKLKAKVHFFKPKRENNFVILTSRTSRPKNLGEFSKGTRSFSKFNSYKKSRVSISILNSLANTNNETQEEETKKLKKFSQFYTSEGKSNVEGGKKSESFKILTKINSRSRNVINKSNTVLRIHPEINITKLNSKWKTAIKFNNQYDSGVYKIPLVCLSKKKM